MNNKPITARVKSGMFKTKEPLLNVGPAGVDGNNKTRSMPSPSKMKGYSMKSSPFKQAKTSEQIVNDEMTNQGIKLGTEKTTIEPGKEGTPDTEIKGNSGSDAFKSAFGDARKSGAKTFDFNGKSYSTDLSKDPDFGKDKIVKGDPGTDDKAVKKKTAIIEKVARKGEASTAYATRNNLRKIKVAARNAKKYQRKKDRNDRREDPSLSAKDQRRARKDAAATSIKEVADSEVRNSQIQSKQGQSGIGASKEIVLDDVNVQQGEKTDTRQRELGNKVTKKTGLFDQFKKPEATAKMSNKGFFKKKSPMKMNYFKK